MKIVQLSDVHFGAQFRNEIFEQVIDEVNELSPYAVIITGDLTNEGLKEEYEGCKELISKLNVKKIIAMPGNHDYRNTGYLHFKKYFLLGFGTEFILTFRDMLISKFGKSNFKLFVDCGFNQSLAINLAIKKINYLKLKSNSIILSKIKNIAYKNTVLLNCIFF